MAEKSCFLSLPPIPPRYIAVPNNQKTIRTKEFAGCIRMKNNEAVELAIILKRFLQAKSMENIRVVLRLVCYGLYKITNITD